MYSSQGGRVFNTPLSLTSTKVNGVVMKKKHGLEADLDPVGTRHTRPGAKIADRALANSKSVPGRKQQLPAGVMKKKSQLEADLDPAGTRHTRPGSKIADRALANSKPVRSRMQPTRSPSSPGRPGAGAAARAVGATKPGRKRDS
jgi:hypothetical protein